jgi:hypothetical protein
MPTTENAYPLTRPTGGTGRITHQLLDEVRAAIARHGFPEVAGTADLGRLRRALDRFVYGTGEAPADRDVAVSRPTGVVEVTGLTINSSL